MKKKKKNIINKYAQFMGFSRTLFMYREMGQQKWEKKINFKRSKLNGKNKLYLVWSQGWKFDKAHK